MISVAAATNKNLDKFFTYMFPVLLLLAHNEQEFKKATSFRVPSGPITVSEPENCFEMLCLPVLLPTLFALV